MGKDRHKKKPLQLRLHELLRQQLEVLAERNASNLTAEITRAVREYLERAGLWPPPAQPQGKATPKLPGAAPDASPQGKSAEGGKEGAP
jgi:hypothetical protein